MKAPTCHPKLDTEGNRNVDQLIARKTIVADTRLRFKEIMDVYDTYYVFTRRLMTFLGIWPYQDPKEQFVRTSAIIFFIISLLSAEVCTLIVAERTLQKTVELLTLTIPTLTFISAYYIPVVHADGIKLVFDHMNYDWSHLKNSEELEIMKMYANQTRRYILVFTVVMYISVLIILMPPILKIVLYNVGVINDFEDIILPVPLEYFVDKNKYFYVLMLHQIICVPLLFSCAIAVYSMFFIIVQHACAAFRLISIPQNTDQWISNCIQRYMNAIEFIDLNNTTGEMCYLWQISLSMALVSLSILHIFEMRNHTNSVSELLYNSSCIPGPIVTTYIACYIGQKLIDHSVDVFQTGCQLSYYNTSLKRQKLLLFLLIRTAKPCTLSVGKMFVFSHEFFSAVIQTCFSYAMVVYTLQ